MEFFNYLRKKPQKTTAGPQNVKVKEIVKSFITFIKEFDKEKNILTSSRPSQKDKFFQSDILLIRQKINEFIKNNFKEKGYKSDPKGFFLCIAEEYYKLVTNVLISSQNILNPNSNLTNDSIINFMKNFYDLEDELYICNKEVLDKIEKNEDSSYLLLLVRSLNYIKSSDILEFILDKDNEISDLGVKTHLIIYSFYKIYKYVNTISSCEDPNKNELVILDQHEENKIFAEKIKKSINFLIPFFAELFQKLINDTQMKTVFSLIEGINLANIFNDLSNVRIVRNSLYDIFIKVNLCTKDGIKIRTFRKYIADYSCLEGLLSSLKNNYFLNEFEDLQNDLFKEIINILIIINGFFDDQKELKLDVYNFLLTIFEDLLSKETLENFIEKVQKFIKEIYYLAFVDREDIRNRTYDRSFENIQSTSNLVGGYSNYKDLSVIEFLLDLFEHVGQVSNTNEGLRINIGKNSQILDKTEFIRKMILMSLLGEEPSFYKYKFLVNYSSYCTKILENLHKYSEEMISYPLNTLLIIVSDHFTSSNQNYIPINNNENNLNNLNYFPEKELKAVLKSMTSAETESSLQNILKHIKTFIDFSPTFQRLFVNCGIFNKILEILDLTLEVLEDNNSTNNKINYAGTEYELNNPIYNINNMNKGISHNFYKEIDSGIKPKTIKVTKRHSSHAIHVNTLNYTNKKSNKNHKGFSADMIMNILKMVEIILNNNLENISIFKSYFFLDNYFDRFTQYSEYKLVAYTIWNISMTYENDPNEIIKFTKFILRRYYVLKETLKKSENVNNFKITLHEILRINEIICVNFLHENAINLSSVNNNQITLKEILLDFVNLLKILKSKKYGLEIEETQNEIKLNENVANDIYWDFELQNILKNFLTNFINLIIQLNKNTLTIKFKYSKLQLNKKKFNKNVDPFIKKEDLKSLIEKITQFLNYFSEKCFLLDFIKFLIDSSLRFKLNEKNENNSSNRKLSESCTPENKQSKHFNFFIYNFEEFYKETFKVDETFLNNCYMSYSNYSNFILQSPMLIKIILSSLKKINNNEILLEFLQFLDFLCKVNENNIKILLKQKLVKSLLDLFRNNLITNGETKQTFEIVNKLIEIFEIITKFMSKSDLEKFFDFILSGLAISKNEMNNNYINTINRLLNIFNKNLHFSKKLKNNITLSSIVTRQPNIYNMLYTGNIKFSIPNNIKEINLSKENSQNNKNKISSLSIYFSLRFYKSLNTQFTLFRFEKENSKDTISFEVYIENNILVVKENDREVYSFLELTKYIRIDKNTIFLFILDKDTNSMEIYINEKLLYAPSLEFKFFDSISSYNLTTGYSGSSTQELYQDSFQYFPHVAISYFMIYADKITKENMNHFKLSQIFNSKNGSSKCEKIKLKYLNKKSYKMFAPHYINHTEILQFVKLNIDKEKVIYELIPDKFNIISNNKMSKLKSDNHICNNFIYKINRKYNIDLLEKDFIVYVPFTNYMNYESLLTNQNNNFNCSYAKFYSNTYLLSKINFADCIQFNQIFDLKNLKMKLMNEIIGIHSSSILDFETQSFNLIDYILIILNEIGDIIIYNNNLNIHKNDNKDNNEDNSSNYSSNNSTKNSKITSYTQTMTNLLKILSLYLISNLHELNDFCDTNHFKTLLIILYKNSKILNAEMIDYIVNLSFGVQDISGINVFNPWYPRLITEILLDIHLFKLYQPEIKIYIINKLMSFLNQKEYIFIMYEANIEIKVVIINRLYKILMIIESNEEIDDMIISLINSLLDQTLKFKKGDVEPTEEQLNRIISGTQEFFLICSHFNESITHHLKFRDFDSTQLNSTRFLVKKFYAKLFDDKTKIFMEKIFDYFTKIREDITIQNIGKRNSSISVGIKVGNLLNSTFFKKLYSKDIEEINVNQNENLSQDENSPSNKSKSKSSSKKKGHNKNTISSTNLVSQKIVGSDLTKTNSTHKSILFTQGNNNKSNDKFNFLNKEKDRDWMVVTHQNTTLQTFANQPENIGEEYITTDNKKFALSNTNFDNDFECVGPDCYLCNFFRDSIKNSYTITQNFNIFTKFIKTFFYVLFHKSPNKKFTDEYLKMKQINFSWNIFNHEGPCRIKNKLIAKIDEIKNEELNKKYYEDQEKIISEEKLHKNSQLMNLLNFMDIKEIFSEVLNTDQIFNLNIVRNLIDDDDKYIASLNCLLINECFQIDCVFILGLNKFYILQNLHIDQEGNLLYSKIKFRRHFWVISDYKNEWNRACPYLNNYSPKLEEGENTISKEKHNSSSMRKISERIKMYKFSRARNGIKINSYKYSQINELHKKRFLHKHNAIEFFMKKGKNFLLCFNVDKRDSVFIELMKQISNQNIKKKGNNLNSSYSLLQNNNSIYTSNPKIIIKKHKGKLKKNKTIGLIDSKQIIEECSESWAQGIISNYSYLILLNTLSGRSFSDISQYLVMPWIIKDYNSEGLNLNTDEIYRNLSYPIHALDENSRRNLYAKFHEAEEIDKFHSGSHYSTPGFVCYYLIRLKPYSYISAEIQGGYFDMADRLFFNIKALWDVSDKYQELIPEIYYLPEAFVNYNEFNFGYSQSHILVNDVLLPKWAKGDPRLFVKMTKKALESHKISQKISEWIDLIFGYKQQGNEANNILNTFRSLCYEGKIDFNKLDEKELEDKMVEIHDFGQIPIQLFTKCHIKKERHEKSLAFFSRPHYLMHFLPREKTYTITLDSKPRNMKGFFEISETFLSSGEGGLSSFKTYHNDYVEEKSSKILDSMNTFSIVGGRKVLLGPKFTNFIDFSVSKYSFMLVQPHSKFCSEFQTFRESPITDIKPTRDGKKLIISFNDGVISVYKLKKEKEKIIHPDYDKKKEKGIFKIFTIKKEDKIPPKKMSVINLRASVTYSQEKEINNLNENKMNIQNKLVQYPFIRAFNTNEEWKDFSTHFNQSGLNLQKNHSKGISLFTISLIESSKFANGQIKLMELCEAFSLLIIVDDYDRVYLLDFNKFKIIRELDYPKITKNFGYGNIRSIKIDHMTGEFVITSNFSVVLFNVNGVMIGYMNIKEFDSNNQIGKITCSLIKSLKNSESEIHLFTGHETGSLFMWRLQINPILSEENFNFNSSPNKDIYQNIDNILDSYRFAYNRDYYYSKIKNEFDLRLKFVLVNEFTNAKKNIPLRLIKLTEDSSMLITIHDDYTLTYLNYSDYFNKKIKSKPTIKICPQCNSQLGSSKYYCSLCDKKLCSQCKIEQIIPEISFKSSKPVCNDCLSMICSTNKMLYDF